MDTYILSCALLLSSVAFSYKLGYFSRIYNWVSDRHTEIKIISSIFKNLHIVSPQSASNSFSISESDIMAIISYSHFGHFYTLTVPFSRSNVASMSELRVTLLTNNSEPIDITQQPGIPYFLPASLLNGYAIRVFNEENGKEYEYSADIAPLYATEVFNS